MRFVVVLSLRAKSSKVMPPSVLYHPGESRLERRLACPGLRGVEGEPETELEDVALNNVVIPDRCFSGMVAISVAVRPLMMSEIVFIFTLLSLISWVYNCHVWNATPPRRERSV